MAETHGATAFPGRLTGRGKPRLEVFVAQDGNIEIRLDDEKESDRWTRLEVNLGALIQWYRCQRIQMESEGQAGFLDEVRATDNPSDELGAR